MKTRLALLQLFFTLSSYSYSQNLVPNPSFEEYKKLICEWIRFLDLYQGHDLQRAFDSLLYYWTTPEKIGGVELFSTLIMPNCSQNGCQSVYCTTNPLSIGGYPKDGNNMCMIAIIGDYFTKANRRGYLQSPLVSSLSATVIYLAGFYSMMPTIYGGDYACNNLGMFFSNQAVGSTAISTSDLLSYVPQVNQQDINKDKGVWKKTSGCFTANGGEQYVTIGNFYDDNHTKAELIVDHYDQGSDFATYVIDSVFLEEIREPFIPNVITPNGDSLNDKFVLGNIHFGWWGLDVYKRWGKSVYHSADYRNTWSGDKLSDGVYYYELSHRCPGISYKGTLTVCR